MKAPKVKNRKLDDPDKTHGSHMSTERVPSNESTQDTPSHKHWQDPVPGNYGGFSRENDVEKKRNPGVWE